MGLAILNLLILVQVDSYLDSLYRFDLSLLKSCISKKSIDQEVSCDIHIADFITNSAIAIKEIQDMFTNITKLSNSTYARVLSGSMKFLANSCEISGRNDYQARFPDYTLTTREGSWCSSSFTSSGYYLQIVSHIPLIFTKIVAGSFFNSIAGVSKFFMSYSIDGLNFVSYQNQIILPIELSTSNSTTNILEPFMARFIRIYPSEWMSYMCMNAEIFGYNVPYTPISKMLNNLIPAIATGFHVVTSSVYEPLLSDGKILLNLDSLTGRAWCAATSSNTEWVLVAAPKHYRWHKIAVQGKDTLGTDRVLTVRIAYSDDGINWVDYKNKKAFFVGVDLNTMNTVEFEPFVALAIKIYAVSWKTRVCMRLEAFVSQIK